MTSAPLRTWTLLLLAILIPVSAAPAAGDASPPSAGKAPSRWLGFLLDEATDATADLSRSLHLIERQLDADRFQACGALLHDQVCSLFGDLGPDAEMSYGVRIITQDHRDVPVDALPHPPQRVVLLVHGLDDPGWMFDDLIPALHERGYVPARFDYPNDGPITAAADLLSLSLRELSSAGVRTVDVVAHSMGGLVARDVLTRPSCYGGEGAGNADYPAIDRLIMVGTPNHGSHLAHLRVLAEMREQIVRAARGGGRLDRHLADGNGEAARDLLPGSKFLKDLNRRPLAQHTHYCTIAGRVSPLDEKQVEQWMLDTLSFARGRHAPRWLREFTENGVAAGVADLCGVSCRVLGDGVVEVDSTRLDGVDDFTIVCGNHMSILVRLDDDDPDPPAISVILDRLGRQPGAPRLTAPGASTSAVQGFQMRRQPP